MSNLKEFMIFAINLLIAKQGVTPGRKGIQVIFKEVPKPGYLTSNREMSRNFWEGWNQEKPRLVLPEDGIYSSVTGMVTLPNNFDWEAMAGKGTPKEFQSVIGTKVLGTVETDWVDPYIVDNSINDAQFQSADPTRYQYSCLVLEGESKFNVFRTQNHPIVSDPEQIQQLEIKAAATAKRNQEGRNGRQKERGISSSGGTGFLAGLRSQGEEHEVVSGEKTNEPLIKEKVGS